MLCGASAHSCNGILLEAVFPIDILHRLMSYRRGLMRGRNCLDGESHVLHRLDRKATYSKCCKMEAVIGQCMGTVTASWGQ